jgi:hypothetical protein
MGDRYTVRVKNCLIYWKAAIAAFLVLLNKTIPNFKNCFSREKNMHHFSLTAFLAFFPT